MNIPESPVQKKVGGGPIDYISQMPDDVLVMILSRLHLKCAVVTGSLSTRWRFMWCNLIKLDIVGKKNHAKMDAELCEFERSKYINQVYSVMKSHTNPMVQYFRICFDLDNSYFQDIDNWIQFALNKKVEYLELDLKKNCYKHRDTDRNYDFPLPLSYGNMVHLSEWPSSNYISVKTLSLKELHLRHVNMSALTLNELLKKSPYLETLYMFGAGLSTHINVGGPDINLKHIKLVDCSEVESISLYDFDLESFTYIGQEIELRLTNLTKLNEIDIGRISVGLENNVFSKISSCASYLQVLSLDFDIPEEGLNVNAIPLLPNTKTLRLTMPAEEDDSLLEFTAIAKACPNLENFLISLHWCSPIMSERKVTHIGTDNPYQHLKLLEIVGYYGRISDLEFAVYVIDNAPALKKIVIDPVCHASSGELTAKEFRKKEKAARSSANCQLTPILPPGVKLVIL